MELNQDEVHQILLSLNLTVSESDDPLAKADDLMELNDKLRDRLQELTTENEGES